MSYILKIEIHSTGFLFLFWSDSLVVLYSHSSKVRPQRVQAFSINLSSSSWISHNLQHLDFYRLNLHGDTFIREGRDLVLHIQMELCLLCFSNPPVANSSFRAMELGRECLSLWG